MIRNRKHLQLVSLKNLFDRHRLLTRQNPQFIRYITNTEIARYLYVTRETISRAMLKMVEKARCACD
ncbi:MAG: hypothetical protein JWP29_5589 [Rhodoferax sp.]|nr:hypothetical protein [Rhodoferax sp.]